MNSHEEQAVASPNARPTNRGMDDGKGLYVAGHLSLRVMRVPLEDTRSSLGSFGACWHLWGHLLLNPSDEEETVINLGPFRLVLVYEPIICLLWNLQEALLAATF